jgi:hypothetical protein
LLPSMATQTLKYWLLSLDDIKMWHNAYRSCARARDGHSCGWMVQLKLPPDSHLWISSILVMVNTLSSFYLQKQEALASTLSEPAGKQASHVMKARIKLTHVFSS